jgi:hypothetical protein
MGFWFRIADHLEWKRCEDCPDHWHFRPSPLGSINERDDDQMLARFRRRDLIHFGNVLERYTRNLERKGRSY